MSSDKETSGGDQFKQYEEPIQPEFKYNDNLGIIARNFFQDNLINRLDQLIEIFSMFPEKLDKLVSAVEKVSEKIDRGSRLR